MATADGGLAAAVHAPSRVAIILRDVPITIEVDTDCPFRSTITYRVQPDRPMEFPLMLRVPGWADDHLLRINGRQVKAEVRDGFVTMVQTWRPGDAVTLTLIHRPVATAGYNGSLSVSDRPLVYVLPVGERWTKLRQRVLSAGWRTDPTTPWNYGLMATAAFHRHKAPVPPIPVDRRAPTAWLTTSGQLVPDWAMDGAYAAPPPAAPTIASAADVPADAGTLRIGQAADHGISRLE